MRFAITSTALLTFLTLATSHVIKRDVDTVLGDLSAINTNLGTLSAAVYSYNGGLPAALEIQTQENAVERALEQATTDTNSTAVFTIVESSTVTEALIALEPVIRSSIAALVSKVGSCNPSLSFVFCIVRDVLTSCNREPFSSPPAWARRSGLTCRTSRDGPIVFRWCCRAKRSARTRRPSARGLGTSMMHLMGLLMLMNPSCEAWPSQRR